MKRCSVLLLWFGLLALTIPVAAQDTFITVTDVVGGIYQLPLSNCPTQGLTYTRSTNSFGCVSGSSAPAGGSNTQVQFNDSGVLGGDAGFTYVKATDTATIGALVLATTPLAATSGGTGFASYVVGDVLYASTTTALSKLADVAAGSYLRSGGASTAPVWSTTTLPNSATTGDLLYASATNVYTNLADVATGRVLVSGGVSTAPAWSTSPTLSALTLSPGTGNILIADTPTLIVDATNHRVGIGTVSPTYSLHVLDTQADWAANAVGSYHRAALTLTANDANAYSMLQGLPVLNQSGFNATATIGLYGLNVNPAISGATGTVTGVAAISTNVQNVGAGTLTAGYGVYGTGPSNGGGGTFTTYANFHVPAQTAATTIYGYRSILAANATRWNLFMDGTAQNHLAGNLGIGTGKTVPLTVLDVADVSTNAVRGIISGQYSASTDGGRLIGRKARGTAAAPTIVTTGDALASWVGEGYDGSNYLQMGAITINSTGTVAVTRVPTTMVFQTATDAAPSVLTTALTLGADQSATFAGSMSVAGTSFNFTTNSTNTIQTNNSSSSARIALIGGGNAASLLTLQSTWGTGTSDYIQLLTGSNGANLGLKVISSGGIGVGATPTTCLQGMLCLKAIVFTSLGTPDNGSIAYCSDCDPPTLVNSTCTHSGTQTGTIAVRVNGVWKCIS